MNLKQGAIRNTKLNDNTVYTTFLFQKAINLSLILNTLYVWSIRHTIRSIFSNCPSVFSINDSWNFFFLRMSLALLQNSYCNNKQFFLKFTEIKIDIKIIYNSYMTFDNQILTLFCHLWAMILQLLCLSLSALLFSFDTVLICLFVVLVAIKIKNILYFYLVYVVNKIKEERCCKEGKFKNLLIHSFNPSRTYLNLLNSW